ncbi:hypothetical protein PFICI_13274 [Pestalotiopsis fici W106-1]|uniref:Uncharacterized protein n=1 Tax=Pestalotiopsis fici (strain W106-1 / CGMCC3.15140) TaxID=1229662 RepID=W3WLL4_PESFW|nr:uncharacterized protein PFICI_13274 [Pestalotiopsis fici W106-1]ETS74790.1 hypothetical protein PFICI_13274 [Pestalotiopsis fici W106-1]
MGDLSYEQQSSGHHNQDHIASEGHLPLRAYSAATTTVGACSTPTTTITYSSIAPFNYNAPYDSSLPTPVSVAGSPSLSDSASVKMVHSFSNPGSTSQQPTPPGTSRSSTADWYSNAQNHTMIRSTQPPSPLTHHAPDILGLLDDTHSPPQQQVIPVTSVENYYGHYGVSGPDPQDDLSPPMASATLFSSSPHINPSALLKGYQMGPSSHLHMAPAPPQLPLMNNMHGQGSLGTHIPHIDNLHNHESYGLGHAPIVLGMEPSYKRAARRGGIRRSQPPRKRQRGSRAARQSPYHGIGAHDDQVPSRAGSKSPVRRIKEEREPRQVLQLRHDKDRPEDHFLFSLREELINEKGKGMWDKIAERYHERYDKKERAALQMQLSRAVLKLAIWPEDEDRALTEAIEEYDKRRYIDILKIMKEKKGCRVWDWKPEHIAKRLSELGEEEYDPDLKPKKIRRRRKEIQREKGQPNLWAEPSPPSAVYDERGLSLQTRNNLSSEEEERLLEAFFVPEEESPANHPDAMDLSGSFPHSRRTSAQQDHQSERVAKQACDQMIAQHSETTPYYDSSSRGQQSYPHLS